MQRRFLSCWEWVSSFPPRPPHSHTHGHPADSRYLLKSDRRLPDGFHRYCLPLHFPCQCFSLRYTTLRSQEQTGHSFSIGSNSVSATIQTWSLWYLPVVSMLLQVGHWSQMHSGLWAVPALTPLHLVDIIPNSQRQTLPLLTFPWHFRTNIHLPIQTSALFPTDPEDGKSRPPVPFQSPLRSFQSRCTYIPYPHAHVLTATETRLRWLYLPV